MEMFSLFVLLVYGMPGKEALVILATLSYWKNLRNPSKMYVAASKDGSRLWSRSHGRTITRSADIVLSVPWGSGSRTGTRDRSSYWRNKWRAGRILPLLLCKCFRHQRDPHHTPLSMHHARCHWLRTIDSIWGPDHILYWHSGRRKQIYWFIKKGSDRNQEAKSNQHIL